MKATLAGPPTVVGQDVTLKIQVERDGPCEEFLVTSCAPGLYEYTPHIPEVRKAIERILVEHEPAMRAMFAAMPVSKPR